MMVYRGHLIAKSEERHPENGKPLYTISELKAPTTPPLLVTQDECIKYVRHVEPYNLGNRIDPYGRKRSQFRKPHTSTAREIKAKASYGEMKYANYET